MTSTPSWPEVFAHRSLATSFDIRAREYARFRPGYPAAAIDAALPPGVTRVLDIGAGTGKLTRSVFDAGVQVVAVEPLFGMVAELHSRLPGALAVAASAENLPLAAASVDAIVIGQAFHWFDKSIALAEMARVLRPGGRVSMLWNHDDESDPMVREIEDALGRAGRPSCGASGRGAANGGNQQLGRQQAAHVSVVLPFSNHPLITDPVLTEVPWQRRLEVDELIGLLHTYSYVIRSSDAVRARLDDEVASIVGRRFPGGGPVRIPVTCQVWRSIHRTPAPG